MTTESIIWLIPLPPVLAFFLIVLFTNKSKWLSHTIALGAASLSWLGSMVVFVRALQVEHLGEHPFTSAINWLPLAGDWFEIGVLVDPLTAVTLFFVAWTILMIFLYSIGYHNFGQPQGDHDRPGLPPQTPRRFPRSALRWPAAASRPPGCWPRWASPRRCCSS